MGMKGYILGILLVGLIFSMAASAGAQGGIGVYPTPEQLGYNYSLTLGAAFPISDLARTDSTVIVGVSWYGPLDENAGAAAALGLSAHWLSVERNDGKSVSLVPLLLNYKQYGIIGSYRVFVNFGIGVIGASDNINSMRYESGANFGWTGGLGVDLTNNVYGQARFIGGENPGDDGIATIELGYRF